MTARAGGSLIEVEVELADPDWEAALPEAEAIAAEAVRAALGDPGFDPPIVGAVSLRLADDAALQALNRQFRGKDAPTNVLSFPAHETAAPYLGDLALAFGVCRREAEDQGKALADHLRHLCVHGALHLVGFDHQDDAEAEEMEALETEILARLGVDDPYA
jgi:probable rRNA maturation factor